MLPVRLPPAIVGYINIRYIENSTNNKPTTIQMSTGTHSQTCVTENRTVIGGDVTWKAGPPSAGFITLQTPRSPKRIARWEITVELGTSTIFARFRIHGGDSATFFFKLLFKLIFDLFRSRKLPIIILSYAASMDSRLLSWSTYLKRVQQNQHTDADF